MQTVQLLATLQLIKASVHIICFVRIGLHLPRGHFIIITEVISDLNLRASAVLWSVEYKFHLKLPTNSTIMKSSCDRSPPTHGQHHSLQLPKAAPLPLSAAAGLQRHAICLWPTSTTVMIHFFLNCFVTELIISVKWDVAQSCDVWLEEFFSSVSNNSIITWNWDLFLLNPINQSHYSVKPKHHRLWDKTYEALRCWECVDLLPLPRF